MIVTYVLMRCGLDYSNSLLSIVCTVALNGHQFYLIGKLFLLVFWDHEWNVTVVGTFSSAYAQ